MVAAGDDAIAAGAIVVATRRLNIRRLTLGDAPFILKLLNDPAWLRFIGDKGVRTLDDARRYIADGPMAMYERDGFGLYLVVRKTSGASMGLFGLIRREGLEDVDIGFALLPEFHGRGYGHEAAAAVIELGRKVFGLERIVAITSPDNLDSIRLIERLGLRFERRILLPHGRDEILLYA
ncbi:MAG: GNAT family N-acetyltransferase [Betaproteobacteria bacterium]